jgi:hypothetical protein
VSPSVSRQDIELFKVLSNERIRSEEMKREMTGALQELSC